MKVAVIGFGNLGQAFVQGLIGQKVVDKNEIFVCANSENTLNKAMMEYGVNASSDITEVIANTDIIFFVIKKKVFYELAEKIDIQSLDSKIIVSFMAGISAEEIETQLKTKTGVVRAMPSIAISQGNGVVGYTKTENSDFIVDMILSKLGLVIPIEESNIEKITAFSACGLGFAAYVLDSFVSAGVELGFDEKLSQTIIIQTFSNAIQMSNYSEIVTTVATKGGATEQGLECFIKNNLRQIIVNAFKRAYQKVAYDK